MVRKINPTNQDILDSQDVTDSVTYRDAQGRQQLERTRIKGKTSPWPWRIAGMAIITICFIAGWFIGGFIDMGITFISQLSYASKYDTTHEAKLTKSVTRPTGLTQGCPGYNDDKFVIPSYAKQVDGAIVKMQGFEDRRTNVNCPAYMPLDAKNSFSAEGNIAYATPQDVPVPAWYVNELEVARAADNKAQADRVRDLTGVWVIGDHTPVENYMHCLRPTGYTFSFAFILALAVGSFAYPKLMRKWAQNNLKNDTSDIQQHEDDQHLMLVPQELADHFDIFPDIGAQSDVVPSALISHVMLTNKGLKKTTMTKFYDKDTEIDGEMYFAGEPVFEGDSDEPAQITVPMIDEKHGDSLFDASGVPDNKQLRKKFDPSAILYRTVGQSCGKLKGDYKTWADVINDDWTIPEYEPTRPAGAYLVDTDPVNTMVLAITRAGKGQTIIEPTLDMWTRCRTKSNIVVNDPKGELLIKNYVKATVRGFQCVQFNLIEPIKTDIYNPLLMAADAAREGDSTKCAQYVEAIGNVFFPADGGEDPVWPNAANNAFQRAAYGMIDYYFEAEKSLRASAEINHISPKTLETKVDELWGKVTLYNCYQLFVQLTSKKVKNPAVELSKDVKNNPDKYRGLSQQEYDKLVSDAEAKAKLWDGAADIDELTLFFNATAALPRNSVRTLVGNADNALRAMGAAEKMLASVYGIAITAMSFFSNPTISTLTSGTPSQNVDLAGLSFPRRYGVRFDSDYMATHKLATMQCKWTGYADDKFTQALGKDFTHTDMITREGWARCFFKGIWPEDIGYLKLEIFNPDNGQLIKTMYFRFEKRYAMSLDGSFYQKDPILDERIVNGGILTELVARPDGTFKTGRTTFPVKTITGLDKTVDQMSVINTERPIISQTSVHHGEKPKMIFLVTPPHLTSYAKLILILIKQLVDLNFEQSYTTKDNQKPLYSTRFMLDELGNLQSDGHGIDSFETMLSIGLGQGQFFTLILQTLQQLRDVYGQDVDKIVQGNATCLNNKVFTPTAYKLMKDIQVGDEVLTPFGNVTTVTGVYPKGVRPVYRVTLRDGSSTVVCNQHLWEVVRRKDWRVYKGVDPETGKKIYVPGGPNGETTRFVHEVMDTMQLKELVESNRHGSVGLPIIDPACHTHKALPIDPYTLGVILGDGYINSKGSVSLTITEKKFGIVDKIAANGIDIYNCDVLSAEGKYSTRYVYRIGGLNSALRALGLAGHLAHDKFIPEQYLYGDVEQRLELLRGLMDTDGYVYKKAEDKCEMEYVTVSEQLAKDVQQLIRSLGGRVAINKKTNVHYTSPTQKTLKAARDAYRLQNIRLPKICPFSLEYKVNNWCDTGRKGVSDGELSPMNYGNTVVSVEYVGEEPVQCIRVADERHLYLTDNYMPTHNTADIIFLKSTDDQMIDTLSKMSGKTHRVVANSKTITTDESQIVMRNDSKISTTMTAEEVPVISYNDMAYIPKCNSIVFRAGTSAIWNRNETALPMSWNLYKNTIVNPGKEYSLKTIPTTSTAKDFDVKLNQPDFEAMLARRVAQAIAAPKAMEAYQTLYNIDDADLARNLGDDNFADNIMRLVDAIVDGENRPRGDEAPDDDDYDDYMDDDYDPDVSIDDNGVVVKKGEDQSAMQSVAESLLAGAEENKEVEAQTAVSQAKAKDYEVKRYAHGKLSRADLVSIAGVPNHAFDEVISAAVEESKQAMFRDTSHFIYHNTMQIFGIDQTLYLSGANGYSERERAVIDADTNRTFGGADDAPMAKWRVEDAFLRFLVSLPDWNSIAAGRFEDEMSRMIDLTTAASGT